MGSPVLGVTVGPGLNFSNLTEPVRILLRLNELEVSDKCEKCLYNVLVIITLTLMVHPQSRVVIVNPWLLFVKLIEPVHIGITFDGYHRTSYTERHKSTSMCLLEL